MAKWINHVISTGRLDVYNNIRGRWAGVFRDGLADINGLFRQYGIGIVFREVNDQNAANIVIASSAGATTLRDGSQTFQVSINGSRLHGHTYPVGAGEMIRKSFILLPENPMMVTPRSSRVTGTKVMRAIQVHEYIHSLGLSDRDHSGDDVFTGFPNHLPGRTPDTDQMGIMRGGINHWFPPYILSPSTLSKIRTVWS